MATTVELQPAHSSHSDDFLFSTHSSVSIQSSSVLKVWTSSSWLLRLDPKVSKMLKVDTNDAFMASFANKWFVTGQVRSEYLFPRKLLKVGLIGKVCTNYPATLQKIHSKKILSNIGQNIHKVSSAS